jgi:hypothetical protein
LAFGAEGFGDGVGAVTDAAIIVGAVVVIDEFVEFAQRHDLRYRHQVVAPKPSNIAFHAAFFMRPRHSWLAVERVEVNRK